MIEWKPFPPENPEPGLRILLSGIWRPFDILQGGDEYVIIANYSRYRENVENAWLTDTFNPIGGYNVDWTHWAELPSRTG